MQIHLSNEDISLARQANLAMYLISRGEQLVKNGVRHKHKYHDSLVFHKNTYYWNSRNECGNSIDYLTKYCHMDFITAVKELTGKDLVAFVKSQPAAEAKKPFDFSDIALSPNYNRTIAYLSKTRGIDYNLIKKLINKGYLYQDSYGNAVFPMRNEFGKIIGAEVIGTISDKKFKQVAKNSEYGYGYNLPMSYVGDLKKYYFFEAVIDMLSYIEMNKANGNLNNSIFVSMAGLKPAVIKNTLEKFKSSNEPIINICVDNDVAGQNFCQLINNGFKDAKIELPTIGKDWNAQIRNIKGIYKKQYNLNKDR